MHPTAIALGLPVVVCAFSLAVTAQDARQLAAQLPQTELVPIHTSSDTASRRASGTWAAGRDYKVSFHDGMVFYPFVGPDHPHHPVRWRTTSVTAGGRELLRPEATPGARHTEWRFEYDHGAVVERYDVRVEGLEQTFVIDARPAAGDLVIRGSVKTPLLLPVVEGRDGALDLRARDREVSVRYGAAVAIDAGGRRTPVLTSCGGDEIALRVPAAWLDRAQFPVVVDPLLSNTTLGTGAPVVDADVLHETHSPAASGGRTWVATSRAVAAGDLDLRVRRFDDQFAGTPTLVFANLDDGEASRCRLALASNGPGNPAYVCTAFQYRFPTGGLQVGLHSHDVNDFTLATNQILMGNALNGKPAIGGSDRGLVMIASQNEAVNLPEESGITFNAIDVNLGINGKIINTFFMPGPDVDQENPSINRFSDRPGGPVWVVAFQEYDNTVPDDDWDIVMVEVDENGFTPAATLSTDDATQDTLHKLGPVIEGTRGRYCVLYSTAAYQSASPKPTGRNGEELRTQRVDWDHTAHAGTLAHPSSATVTAGARRLVPEGLGCDSDTRSHWCAAYRDMVAGTYHALKLGYRGLVVESADVLTLAGSTAAGGGVHFNAEDDEFMLVLGRNNGSPNGNGAVGGLMVYETVPAPTLYGSSCGAGRMRVPSRLFQRIGIEGATIELENVNRPGFAYLMLSPQRTRLNLGFLNMPGCELLVELTPGGHIVVPLPIASREASLVFDVPEGLLPFRLYFQWLYPGPGGGLQTSEGLAMDFGL